MKVSCPHPCPEATGVKSKCLRLATGALWYVRNRQIHEDLDVPKFADHIRALTESFESVLVDYG